MTAPSPIVLMQRRLYGTEGFAPIPGRHRTAYLRAGPRLGAFGLAANTQSGSSVYSGPPVGAGSGKGAATGAVQGASVGAVAGPIGMAIGAAIGAIGGAIAGALGKRDPEQANFDQAVAIYNANPNGILALNNKYLPLAGLFDLNIKTNIPIYKKYGRMGEQRFLSDMAMLIHDAAQSGVIGPADTPQTIMVKVVQPWIDKWGFGPMSDPHAAMINMLLMGLVIDYVTGNEKNWLARGGDYPFKSLPAFTLPIAAQPVPFPNNAAAQPPPRAMQPFPFPSNAVAQPPRPVPISPTSVPIPAGFSVGGIDSATGLPVYSSPNGGYFTWTGTTMIPFTGTLTSGLTIQGGGAVANNNQALPPMVSNLPALNTGSQQLFNSASSPMDSAPPAAPGQISPPVSTAGISGLPSWVSWGAVAGMAVLMFATARPVGRAAPRGRFKRGR